MEALIPIMMFLSIAAVAIFRPLTKRLGLLLEAQAEEKRARHNPQLNPNLQQQGMEGEQTRMLMARLDRRLDLLEQRLDFNESLMDNTEKRRRIEQDVGMGNPAALGSSTHMKPVPPPIDH